LMSVRVKIKNSKKRVMGRKGKKKPGKRYK